VTAGAAGGTHDVDVPEPFKAVLSGPESLVHPVLWYGAGSNLPADTFFYHFGFFSSNPGHK